MKPLKRNVILYDDECPMCDLYTNGFVKSGMLDENGRIPFSGIDQELRCMIDEKRACNEIALIDIDNKRVRYGAESIVEILGNNYPTVARLFRVPILRWMVIKIYSFISYNRKVIVPGSKNASCVPSFSMKYRVAYMLFAGLLTGLILHAYSARLFPLINRGKLSREFMIVGGQVLFQSFLLLITGEKRMLEYLGNMMTVSLLGSLLLLPGLLFGFLPGHAPAIFAVYFMLVVGVMFAEHCRRVRLLDFHWSVSIGWVTYRLAILGVLL